MFFLTEIHVDSRTLLNSPGFSWHLEELQRLPQDFLSLPTGPAYLNYHTLALTDPFVKELTEMSILLGGISSRIPEAFLRLWFLPSGLSKMVFLDSVTDS